MKYTDYKLASLALIISLITPFADSAPLLEDSFESANLSGTNADGFKWSSTNRTSIVTMENGSPYAVYNGSTIHTSGAAGTDWTAKDGSYSLRFRYPAGEFWSEQRFSFGKSYRDIWLRYWVRVPTNYSHGTANPSNHKFFAIWMDQYEGTAPLVIWEFWGSGSGGSTIGFHFRPNGGRDGSHQQQTPFASTADRGKWMQVVLHVKAATTGTSNDGVIQMWRKWNGESSFTKLHEHTTANLSLPATGPQGWSFGYFMGWANAAYAADTEWLLDGLVISNESLLTEDTPAPSIKPPQSPKLSAE